MTERTIGLLLLFTALAVQAGQVPTKPPTARRVTAVLGALPAEVDLLASRLQHKHHRTVLGLKLTVGKLGGRTVVLAHSGCGKVNAAVATTLLLDRFAPRELIFTGVAGGLNPGLAPGDIVIGQQTTQHDYGEWNPQGFQPGPTLHPDGSRPNPRFFAAPPRLVELAEAAARQARFEPVSTTQGRHVPRVVRGVLVTGDTFIASADKSAELRQLFGADAVEMEGAVVAQICWQQKVPCLVIRSLSDRADAQALADFARFLGQAATNSATLTAGLIELLAREARWSP
jgi:adenosylhomocysteine nucleosidase